MIPVSFDDVVDGLATAQQLHKIGFRRAKNASQKYREFGEDIRSLAINLDLLSDVIRRAQYHSVAFNWTAQDKTPALGVGTAVDQQVLGNFVETLNDCRHLLDDQRYFQKCDGFVSNICWYYQIDPEVQKLRERLSLHNIKLSISLKILDLQVLEDRSIQIIDSTRAIMSAVEQLGQQVHGVEEDKDLPYELPVPAAIAQGLKDDFKADKSSVAIPLELQHCFNALTQQVYPDFSTLSLCRGIDATLLYFNEVTKTPEQPVQSEIRYLLAVIDIMKAAWMLRTVKTSQKFQIAARYCSVNALEQQMDQWGMTIERFFGKLEQDVSEAFRLLLGRHHLLPPTLDLLEILERERQVWPAELGNVSKKDNESIELGTKIMSADLRSSDPGYTQTMHVYHHAEKRYNLVLLKTSTSKGKEKETIDGYDLERLQIIPSYAKRTWASPSLEPQTILFRVDGMSPVSRTLAFHQNKDLFEFQQTTTGYKVVHDDGQVLTTSQESKMFRGMRRQDLCRLQLWLASPLKIDAAAAKPTPDLAPTAIESRRSPRPLFTNSMSLGRKTSASNMRMFSSGLQSSSSSRSSVVVDSPSLPNFTVLGAASNTQGTIHKAPVPPCIVLFAHKALAPSRGSGEEEAPRSFLIIDITADVTVQEELAESEGAYGSSYQCVIERKGSYLPARRSPEINDAGSWDLSVAGLYKREAGTEAVKRLRHVIIQFETQKNLSQFMTKFGQVQDLAKLRLSQLSSRTRAVPGSGIVELP